MITLLPFQKEGVELLHKFKGRALLADSMGLGKTVQALQYLADKPKFRPALIVCPATLKWNWQRDAKRHFGIDAEVLGGTDAGYGPLPDVSIINYDVLDSWRFRLEDAGINMIIADECQNAKNRDSIRTKVLIDLVKPIPKRLFLSGTPIENRPSEFWPVLHMIDPKRWPNFHVFGHRYCGPRRKPWGWQFNGASRLDELHAKLLETCMIRRRKEDVLQDLPAKQRNVHLIEMNKEDKAEYRRAQTDLVSWLRTNYRPGVVERVSKAEALAKTSILETLLGRLKTPYVIEWAKDFIESGRKLIVFAIHQQTCADLRDAFPKSAMINGTVVGTKRQVEVDRFNNDPKCMLLAGNIKAAGAGWSATACSDCAKAEMDWVPGRHNQAEDRTHGLYRGVKDRVSTSWYLVVKGTLDETKCKRLMEKQDVLDRTLDGEARGEFDVFNEVVGDMLAMK